MTLIELMNTEKINTKDMQGSCREALYGRLVDYAIGI